MASTPSPIRVAIVGYGNLGRGVELAVAQNADMQLAAVFTRRDPGGVRLQTAGVPVHGMDDIAHHCAAIDVLILCGGSKEDLPQQSPQLAAQFCLVDSFDTHAYLNDLRHGNDTKESEEFHRRLGRYRERYLFPDGQTAEEN